MVIDEQFKQDFIKHYNFAVLMENKTNDDYNKTQQLIEESENIIQKYAQRYDGIINSKDNEINILKIQLQDLKNETYSIMAWIANKYWNEKIMEDSIEIEENKVIVILKTKSSDFLHSYESGVRMQGMSGEHALRLMSLHPNEQQNEHVGDTNECEWHRNANLLQRRESCVAAKRRVCFHILKDFLKAK